MKSSNNFTLGFVKLTDAAPYIVAQEMGLFSKYGINVTLVAQNSWVTLRDKLEAGIIDAAHILAPMPIASAMGISGARTDIMTPLITSQNGNGITISNILLKEICVANELNDIPLPMPASLLQNVITTRKQNTHEPLRLASVFPFSCHYLQLLDYLAEAKIPKQDVELLFMPPNSMANSLDANEIDGFCVGGPYNAISVRDNNGATIITSYDIWKDKAEKVLGITQYAYDQRPEQYHRLCAAIIDACEWLKEVPNRFEAARMLAKEEYLDSSIEVIAPSLIGSCLTWHNATPRHIPHYNRFCSSLASQPAGEDTVNRPTYTQGQWLLEKLQAAWPQLINEQNQTIDMRTCFREDIFNQAVATRYT